jgi:hypothetical protein
MASWQTLPRRGLQPIPRVVDNTDALAINQWLITMTKVPVVTQDSPGGPGTFAPYGNNNFR